MAAAMRERMESLVDHVLGRAELPATPTSSARRLPRRRLRCSRRLAERLEDAVFNPGEGAPLDPAQLARFFQSSFGSPGPDLRPAR